MKKLSLFISICLLCSLGIFTLVSHRTVYATEKDPSGKYTAIVSYKTYLSFLPMPPGSSSDKPCYVKILDENGNNYGEIPVAMLQLAGVQWSKEGAEVTLVGEWDFKRGTCYYWSDDGSTKIFTKR